MEPDQAGASANPPEPAGEGYTLESVLDLKHLADLALYLLTDIVNKAIPYGTQEGEFVASYLLQTGPIHRAIAFLQQQGIPITLLTDGEVHRGS